MSTTTTKKPAARKPAAKPAPAKKEASVKPAAPKEPMQEARPEPKTLVEALATGQAVLLKVPANGTRRSLPYLAVGTEGRKQAEAVATRHAKGETIPALAEDLNVSPATARRFLTNLALAQDVESGKFDKSWRPGAKEVVVHTVAAKQAKA